jgi:hypothetical protein
MAAGAPEIFMKVPIVRSRKSGAMQNLPWNIKTLPSDTINS